jgi:parallel beta-helix repeat protein
MHRTLNRSLALFMLLTSLVFTSPANAQAHNYSVSTGGLDSADGSSAHPWRTIQHGADQLSPGDTLLINPGVYQESGITISRGGTAAAPVTFKANGAGVIIDQSGSGMRRDAFFITYASYVVVDGLTFQNSNRAGMRIDHSDYVTVRSSTFANNQTWGLFTDFSNYTTVEDSESYGTAEQHGIYISNSSDHPTIQHNRLHDNANCGLHMNGDISQQPGDGIISNGLVDGNIIYNNGAGGGSAINMDGVTDTTVSNNLLYNNHASGISLFQTDGGSGSKRNKIYNNTILMPTDGRWAINIPEPDSSLPNPGNTSNQVLNNILYNQQSFRGVITIGPSDRSGFRSDNNVLMGHLSADDNDSVISLAAWQALGYDRHSLVSTPAQLFVNPAVNNYHLTASSPAVDKGTTLSEVTDDLEQRSRPYGFAYDIGAYEYPSVLPDMPNKVYLPGISY